MNFNIKSILNLSAFRTNLNDPNIPLAEKLAKKPFVTASITTRHIKFARAQLQNQRVILGPSKTGFNEDIFATSQNEPYFQEMLELVPQKLLVLGLNLPFSLEKNYPKGTKLRETERLIKTSLAKEISGAIDLSNTYHVFPVRNSLFLASLDQGKIDLAIKKFQEMGFTIAAVYNLPCAVIHTLGEEDFDWSQTGMAAVVSQHVISAIGWSPSDIILTKTRTFTAGGPAKGQRTTLPGVQNTATTYIRDQLEWIKRKAGAVQNLYLYTDTPDLPESLSKLEGTTLHTIPWTHLSKKVQFPSTEVENPDLACLL